MTRLLLACLACSAFAQSLPPAFEVASIRESQTAVVGGKMEGHGRENIQVSPDSVTMRNASLRTCIRWAYHVMDYQVNGPDVIARQRFDIIAKAGAPAGDDQLLAMMQTMLSERFKLSFHRLTKEQSGYVLIVGKGGPKFTESKENGESSIDPDIKKMVVTVQRTPISQLIEMLSNIFRAPVIDETALKGKYDITINVAKYMAEFGHAKEMPAGEAPPDPMSIIMRGVQEELGLKLEARSKLPVDYLVVDHIEKAPTEN